MSEEKFINDLEFLYKHRDIAIKGVKDGLNISDEPKYAVKKMKVGGRLYERAVLLTISATFMDSNKSLYSRDDHDAWLHINANFYEQGDSLSQKNLEYYLQKLDYKVPMETRKLIFSEIKEEIETFNPKWVIDHLDMFSLDSKEKILQYDYLENAIILIAGKYNQKDNEK